MSKNPAMFGTDGIRGKAGNGHLSSKSVLLIGEIVGSLCVNDPAIFRDVFPKLPRRPRGSKTTAVIVGSDTRISGASIKSAMIKGLLSSGVDVWDAGVVPTPALSFLASFHRAPVSVMITASHNPFDDNGIKLISSDGLKASARAEAAIEKEFHKRSSRARKAPRPGRLTVSADLLAEYENHVIGEFSHLDLSGKRIVLDCAHGAATGPAPRIFRALGAEVTAVFASPDGRNINADCGALHPDKAGKAVRSRKASAGFAFDGDADRVMAVDENGSVIDGDFILAAAGRYLSSRRALPRRSVVTTVMHNLCLRKLFKADGIRIVETPVGDKYVAQEMFSKGYAVGGEQSGHIIFGRHSSTGDGIVTALMVLEMSGMFGGKLSGISAMMKKCPQVLINVKVARKPEFSSVTAIRESARAVEKELGDSGRLLLRYSGTEPLARVMIEGDDIDAIDRLAKRLAAVISRELS